MSVIYERLRSNVTNEVYHNECNDTQFQFHFDDCVSVWNNVSVIWLMLESDGVCNDGRIRNVRWIRINGDGIVS